MLVVINQLVSVKHQLKKKKSQTSDISFRNDFRQTNQHLSAPCQFVEQHGSSQHLLQSLGFSLQLWPFMSYNWL